MRIEFFGDEIESIHSHRQPTCLPPPGANPWRRYCLSHGRYQARAGGSRLTHAELARRAGVAPSNLSAIESGKRQASAAMISRILDATGRPSAVLRERRDEVVAMVQRLGGRDPRVFGSVARGEDGPDSDIDLLVRAEPGRAWDFVTLPRELSALLGVSVDVVAESGLRPTDDRILAEAVPL